MRDKKKIRNTRFKVVKILKHKRKRGVVEIAESNSGDIPAFSKTFLLGTLADILYEIKNLAKITARTRNARIKKACITKLKVLLRRYHERLGIDFKESISIFIYDTFKNLKVPHQNLHEIKSWWIKDAGHDRNMKQRTA